ncbi:hypothetical protein NDU88_001715 [Pleurodeles waltl]|uniref:Uncharacterized protein n=1 Tax=Pleurodeles waltl TaxID=8319 RepID=A0AAV7V8K2_PLEWA|nr:hypothetical protein NDU88_001715 [Pleurodeles waltl]
MTLIASRDWGSPALGDRYLRGLRQGKGQMSHIYKALKEDGPPVSHTAQLAWDMELQTPLHAAWSIACAQVQEVRRDEEGRKNGDDLLQEKRHVEKEEEGKETKDSPEVLDLPGEDPEARTHRETSSHVLGGTWLSQTIADFLSRCPNPLWPNRSDSVGASFEWEDAESASPIGSPRPITEYLRGTEESRVSPVRALKTQAGGKRLTLCEEGVCMERDAETRQREEEERQRRDEDGRKNGDDLLQERRHEEKEEGEEPPVLDALHSACRRLWPGCALQGWNYVVTSPSKRSRNNLYV